MIDTDKFTNITLGAVSTVLKLVIRACQSTDDDRQFGVMPRRITIVSHLNEEP